MFLMNLQKYIGQMIKYFRKQNDMTQEQLADKLHTTKQSISRYESGERKVDQDLLFELSEIFNVRLDEFFPEREGLTPVENEKEKLKLVPIVGKVAAGSPNYAIEDVIGYMTLPPDRKSNDGLMYLEVNSDSMDKKFAVGSYVLVDTNVTVENGDIAVIKINGNDATLKQIKFDEEGKSLMLIPDSHNPKHFPVVLDVKKDEVSVVGKVVGVYQSI